MDWRDNLLLVLAGVELGAAALAAVLAFTIGPLIGIAVALPVLIGGSIVGNYL